MDDKGKVGSSSSFTSDLFGASWEPTPSSNKRFASLFPPPSVVLGRKSSTCQATKTWQKQQSAGNQNNQGNKGRSSTIFEEERTEPCNLSSSLYYGGQDNYSHSSNNQQQPSANPYPNFKKDGGEGDPTRNTSNDASRGNWWQGSLYY